MSGSVARLASDAAASIKACDERFKADSWWGSEGEWEELVSSQAICHFAPLQRSMGTL